MTLLDATYIYIVKSNGKAKYVDFTHSQQVSPRVVVLKGNSGERLACVVESKKGYVVDICKKNHL